MPQSRRKTPFSGKAKKQQLQAKKQNKAILWSSESGSGERNITSISYQSNRNVHGRNDKSKYALKFYTESPEELTKKKEEALQSLRQVSEDDLEIDPLDYFPPEISFPKRPPWNYDMTTEELNAKEQKYFMEYVNMLQNSPHWREMSYFELNLETWRQLWRVLEMCDILLYIVDIRFAGVMFPPSLYTYIMNESKHIILVMNKIDLVPSSVVAAWKAYLESTFPEIKVVYFTTCPGYNLRGAASDKGGLQIRRRRGKPKMCIEGATKIFETCKYIVQNEVDLSSWEHKIKEESSTSSSDDDKVEIGLTSIVQKSDTSYYQHVRFKNGVVTLGCVGQPNVGKSSLINALMGRKVVSVSRTPGHTKHFQTIYLTPQVRLCDCPGLVFPSKVPRHVQILMGSYPIAQVREPYTTIRYLAERLDLPKILRIEHPDNDVCWSPRDVCDGWAKKRGYYTAKAARLDTARSANSILRMALDGRICIYLRPIGYATNRANFENSEDVKYIKWVQALNDDDRPSVSDGSGDSDDHSTDDSDESDRDDDDSDQEPAAIANKFSLLASE